MQTFLILHHFGGFDYGWSVISAFILLVVANYAFLFFFKSKVMDATWQTKCQLSNILTPTLQGGFQLIHVIQATIFSFHYVCISAVFKASSSCVNLRHALFLFSTTARLMRWPGEPRCDCLTRLSASWLWASLSGDNVSQILLLICRFCTHEAARRPAFQHKQTSKPHADISCLCLKG